MDIAVTHDEHFTVIKIKGIVDTIQADDLLKVFKKLIENKHIYLVVDCEELEFLASGGIRAFLIAVQDTRALGGMIHFCNLPDKVSHILNVSGFLKHFQHFTTRQDAETTLIQIAKNTTQKSLP